MSDVWAVVAGGGTAGHVNPALAIADELVERGHAASSLHFIGSKRGLEADLVPRHGYELTLLPGRGIQRRLTIENLRSAAGLAAAIGQAFNVVRRLSPSVLIAVGGYASLPAAAAAAALRIPIIVMEQNTVPGAANRFASRWAKACAVSFPDTDLARAVHTGNPCGPEVLAVDRSDATLTQAAKARLGIEPHRRLVAAFGGSLGARRINDAVLDAAELLADRDDLAIRHVIGNRDWPTHGERDIDGALQYQSVRYEEAMQDIYQAADLLLSRAGATSVAEIALTGSPAVLVPLPGAPGDHQTLNARALTDDGGGILVRDDEFDGRQVDRLVTELLADPEQLDRMGAVAAGKGRRDAAAAIADLIEEHARAR